MKDRKSKLLRNMGIIVIVLVIILGGGYFAASRGLSEMQELVINDVSPGEVADGVYTGEFNQYRWSYRVDVTVQGGKIVDIQFINGGTLEQELAERIITKQSLDVDINTGATVNSKAFLKAVETALIR
ncbi:MAG: FMN-binding protein [Bacillota bacterium]